MFITDQTFGLDDEHDTIKKEKNEEEGGDHEGYNKDSEDSDSWEEMYQAVKETEFGVDDDGNSEDGGEDKGERGADNEDEDERGADNEDEDEGNHLDISGSRNGGGDEGGSEDGDGNNRKESNGSRGVSGRKDDEGRKRMKRKNQDDEPAARAKRTKRDVSGGHQAVTQPTKRAPSKRGQAKKRIDN
jgi:hypothetical protein